MAGFLHMFNRYNSIQRWVGAAGPNQRRIPTHIHIARGKGNDTAHRTFHTHIIGPDRVAVNKVAPIALHAHSRSQARGGTSDFKSTQFWCHIRGHV